jgi:ribosome assembly protein YihI (activator of Der GTPase)
MPNMTEENATSIHLSKRMCSELNQEFTRDKRDDEYPGWYKLKRILDYGLGTKTGTTVDLNYTDEESLIYLLDLFKRVEKRSFHKQLVDALRDRIEILSSKLGVSAIDRLGEIIT